MPLPDQVTGPIVAGLAMAAGVVGLLVLRIRDLRRLEGDQREDGHNVPAISGEARGERNRFTLRATVAASAIAGVVVIAVWMVIGPWPGFVTFLALVQP